MDRERRLEKEGRGYNAHGNRCGYETKQGCRKIRNLLKERKRMSSNNVNVSKNLLIHFAFLLLIELLFFLHEILFRMNVFCQIKFGNEIDFSVTVFTVYF